MAEKKDYAEVMLEAVDTVVKKRIEAVSFDKTIDAVIVDDINGANGVYQVSADGVTFTAYSTSTDYKKNDSVMVTIPQGNYDNQKIIIGKKVTKQADSMMIYKSPFAAIADLTGNLIHSNINGYTTGIYANYTPDTQVWENIDLALTGYTRLGFVGEFSTWLQEYGTVSGTYGVKIILTIKNPDNSDSTYEKILSFTSDEFFGNVYSFYSYTSQEIVFDISDYANEIITKIQLKIFQNNDFYDKNGQRIPAPPPEDDEDNVFSLIPPNIYLKDPYICCGVDANTFTNDSCLLVTNSSTSYHKKMASGESETDRDNANKKIITLRWIHKDDVSGLIHIIDQGSVPTDYEIQWYRYNLEAVNDGLMGAHWERLKYQYKDQNNQKNVLSTLTTGYADFDNDEDKAWFIANKGLKINFYPRVNNPNERLVAMVVRNGTKVAQSPELIFTNDDEVRNIATYVDDNALAIKATDGTGGQYAGYNRANNLIQASEATVIRTLQAVFDDSEHPADIYNRSDLSNCTDIIWYFPRNRSMITLVDADGNTLNENAEKIDIDEIDNNYYKIEYQRDPYEDVDDATYYQLHYCIKKSFSNYYNNNIVRLEVKKDGQWYQAQIELRFLGAGTSGSDYTILLDHPGVNSYFTKTGNNGSFEPIQCTLFVQNSDFQLVQLPPGAKYKLEWVINNSGGTTQASATALENQNNISVDTENHVTWVSPDENIASFNLSSRNNNINTLHILKVTLKDFQEYDLTAYFPIPSRQNYQNSGHPVGTKGIKKITLTGADVPEEVRYASSGEADFYKNPCTINAVVSNGTNTEKAYHNGIDFIISDSSVAQASGITERWSLTVNNDTMFTPSLREGVQHKIKSNDDEEEENDGGNNNKYNAPVLNPPGIYFEEATFYGIQFRIEDSTYSYNPVAVWTQPIYAYRDNYPSTTLNKWNGKDIQLNEDEGTVVANGFAAGKKESDNSFTGVILGDWSRSDTDQSITKNTGIYGMHHGAMAYAIKDDGTMFLGKDGSGRIEFNGNTAEIYSASYATARNGMYLNLATGEIQLKSADYNETTILPGYFKISAAHSDANNAEQEQHTLIEIDEDNYYLQSYDFDQTISQNHPKPTGVKFDLNNGELIGYKFDLLAGTGNHQIKLTSDDSQGTNGNYNKKPLEIGQQFNVSWEGDVFANGGNIAGWYFKQPEQLSSPYDTNIDGTGINGIPLEQNSWYGLYSNTSNIISNNYRSEMFKATIQLHPKFGLRLWKPHFKNSDGEDVWTNNIVLDPEKPGAGNQDYTIIGRENSLSDPLTIFPDHKQWPLSIAQHISIYRYINGTQEDTKTSVYPTPFAVDWDGTLYSARGTIGGWTIKPGELSSTATVTIENQSIEKTIKFLSGNNPGIQIWKGSDKVFEVANDGNLTVGGWTIDPTVIKKGAIVLDSSGNMIRAGNNTANAGEPPVYPFSVDTNGALTAKRGTIGGWYITTNTLQNAESSPTIKFDSSAGSDSTLKIGDTFKVSSGGELTASAGTIGGWQIDTNSLSNGGITLSAIPHPGKNKEESAYIDAPAYYSGDDKFVTQITTIADNCTYETIRIPDTISGQPSSATVWIDLWNCQNKTFNVKDLEGNVIGEVEVSFPQEGYFTWPSLSLSTLNTSSVHTVLNTLKGKLWKILRVGAEAGSNWTLPPPPDS